MDDVQNRFARELADAIATAVAQSADVESCRERARAAGFDLKVTLEATVGFASRGENAAETAAAGRRGRTAAQPGDHRQRPPVPALAAHRRRRGEGRGSELTPEQRPRRARGWRLEGGPAGASLVQPILVFFRRSA